MQTIDLIKTIANQAAQIEKLRAELDEAILARDEAIKSSLDDKLIDIGTINTDNRGTYVGNLSEYRIRFRCNDVVIEAQMPAGAVTATYDNGPKFKWCRDLGLEITLGDEIVRSGQGAKGNLYAEVIGPERTITISRCKYSREYDLSFSEKFSKIVCKDEVSFDVGEYALKIAATIKSTNVLTFGYPVGYNFIELRTGGMPIFCIDSDTVFNCATMKLEKNRWWY